MTARLQATTLSTPAGPFTFLRDEQAVVAAGFTADVAALQRLVRGSPATAPVAVATASDAAALAFTAYFDGDLDAVATLPVAAQGTAHQQRTWEALRALPPGAPVTYGQLAVRVGSGARATGSACGRNPAAVVVPCHRVVRGDGTLGGFVWGTEAKKWLLDHERRYAGVPVRAAVIPAWQPPRRRARGRTLAEGRRS